MSKILMSDTDVKKVTVIPKDYRVVPDILKKRGLVDEPMELELNKDEIFRAMNYADVIDLDGTNLNETNYFMMDEEVFSPMEPEPTPEEPEEPSNDVNSGGCFEGQETEAN